MEGSDGSPPSSLWMIRAAELFPKPQMEKEDEQLTVPFQDLAGESVRYLGRTDDGVLALSNYRLFLLKTASCAETSVPLGLIESAQTRDLFHLIINCKDASTVKCSFATAEQCLEWSRRISLCVGVPENLESLFAFPFYSWTSDSTATSTGAAAFQSANNDNNEWSGRLQRAGRYEEDFRKEVDRLQFDLNGTWRISYANSEFKLCPSYPGLILVPCCISDETLQNVASFRGSRRLPAVVWRHKQSGAVIARSSQPEVGWLGWRCSKDEQFLKALADACAFDRGEQNRRQNLCPSGESSPSSADGSHVEVSLDEVRKILIVDARSYTSAVTNRARGGGCECIDYYPCAEIEFMNLGNIHAIRKSFHALRQLCASPPDVPNWLGTLERTMWLQHLSGLLAASMTVCHAIEKKGRPVLVHCSDGWDRTPQIVATAQLCLDPFYRTVEGFRILVEREWLSYGHKFADRCGHGPGSDELNERCPVFLQWLDLVHQIHSQFPCSFEFSMAYLIKLAQHSHSCLFGTFLCNTVKERIANSVLERTFSVWPFLSGPMYRNPLYMPNREKVLWPAHNVRDLMLWSEVYLGSLGNQNPADYPPNNVEGNQESTGLTKTRSYGDLVTIGGSLNGFTRRSSDPNMTGETHLMMTLSDTNSIESERAGSPDLLTNIMQDTTEKLQNLTNELNQSDDDAEICKINNFDNRQISDDIFLSRKFLQIEQNQQEFKREQEQSAECDITNCINLKDPFGSDSSRYEMIFGKRNSNDGKGDEIIRNGEHQTENCIANSRIELHDEEDDCKDEIDGILNRNKADYNDMMQSVDLQAVELANGLTISNESQSPWHGSVETSTDTLVPIESHNSLIVPLPIKETNGDHAPTSTRNDQLHENNHDDYVDSVNNTLQQNNTLYHIAITPITATNSSEPEVHCNKAKFNDYNLVNSSPSNSLNQTSSLMDESIFILPEHEKLEISNSGKCCDSSNNVISSNYLVSTAMASTHPHRIRRRRTSSTNSKNDLSSFNKNICGSTTNSRFSTPGVRSLPLTPPGASDRPPVAISCPDGLAHALSEQNIRLQQIVHEHKLREDALQKELYGMRLALLKKTCPHCNNQTISNDEQCSVMDNIENSSICSWEAVEERSAPSSGANSAQPTSVLWVPDHAVSQCTGCETEFWLGRRKHHCRSCGQIFCADCSEFWAPVPDERLYTPVRLCGPCYHAVTTRIQQQSRACSNSTHSHYQKPSSSITTTASLLTAQLGAIHSSTTSSSSLLTATVVATTASVSVSSYCGPPTSMEACKHAASPQRNDRSSFKVTAASN